jgi:hypothetical protein
MTMPSADRPGTVAGRSHGLTGVADAGAFLARLTRLEAAALVRLRSSGTRTGLWARLPWDVLVTREVAGAGPADATVSAGELLARLAGSDPGLPPRRDGQWRWPLPPAAASVVESVAVAELAGLAEAAAGTLREATEQGVAGRAVGQRVLRDALLDHVALVVTAAGHGPVRVPQRLVQAVSRMGFLGPAGGPGGSVRGPAEVDGPAVRVLVAGRWVGLSAPYGVAWLQPVNALTVMPIKSHLIG